MWLLKELNIVLLLTGLLFVQTCVHCDQLKSLFVVIRHGMSKFLIQWIKSTIIRFQYYWTNSHDHFGLQSLGLR